MVVSFKVCSLTNLKSQVSLTSCSSDVSVLTSFLPGSSLLPSFLSILAWFLSARVSKREECAEGRLVRVRLAQKRSAPPTDGSKTLAFWYDNISRSAEGGNMMLLFFCLHEILLLGLGLPVRKSTDMKFVNPENVFVFLHNRQS